MKSEYIKSDIFLFICFLFFFILIYHYHYHFLIIFQQILDGHLVPLSPFYSASVAENVTFAFWRKASTDSIYPA